MNELQEHIEDLKQKLIDQDEEWEGSQGSQADYRRAERIDDLLCKLIIFLWITFVIGIVVLFGQPGMGEC